MALYQTPEVFFIGKIESAQNFGSSTLYCKYSFKYGDNWRLISGKSQGDTF